MPVINEDFNTSTISPLDLRHQRPTIQPEEFATQNDQCRSGNFNQPQTSPKSRQGIVLSDPVIHLSASYS